MSPLEITEGIEFSAAEAPGAWPNGTRVRKVLAAPGDLGGTLPVGTKGTICGSLGPFTPPMMGSSYGYFVQWDGWGACVFFVRSARLAKELTQ